MNVKPIALLLLVCLVLLTACEERKKLSTVSTSDVASDVPVSKSSIPESSTPNVTESSIPESSTPDVTESSTLESSVPNVTKPTVSASSNSDTPLQDAAPLTFRGETVTSIYSLDLDDRMYYLLTDRQLKETALTLLEDYDSPEYNQDRIRVGFLIFTDKTKYPLYLYKNPNGYNKDEEELLELADICNQQPKGYMQWIAYMSTENIVEARFVGQGGGRYTHNPEATSHNEFALTLNTNDLESIRKISNYIKDMAVVSVDDIVTGAENFYGFGSDPGIYDLWLTYKNGVVYYLHGSGSQIVFHDAHEQIFFTLQDDDAHKGLRDLIASLPETKVISGN